ncbi:prolyl 4-hydroxylase subunit alpha-1 [Aplysia californica]|uniref:procollagen-proline 4-dioxygenase n=1 Tax=Aplysia californica TaxID=6500 RepID=A0ABM0K0E4_APLCA|nr:prolyl 4-hydroxylase subunit alpha-1 [Aplysia californica]
MALVTSSLFLALSMILSSEGQDLLDPCLSSHRMQQLMDSESNLLKFLNQTFSDRAKLSGESHYEKLSRSASRFLAVLPENNNDVVDPLRTFLGIKRFLSYYGKFFTHKKDKDVFGAVQRSLEKQKMKYPDKASLGYSIDAILRLMTAYDLDFDGMENSSGVSLSSEDKKNIMQRAKEFGLEAKGSGNGKKFIEKKSRHQVTDTDMTKYNNLCRLSRHNSYTPDNRLSCSYAKGLSGLAVWKQEVLSRDPYIAVFYDVITKREATSIMNTGAKILEGSGVMGKNKTSLLHHRLSASSWLWDNHTDTTLNLSRRVEEITSLRTEFRDHGTLAEPFQIVNYGLGGHYFPHMDYHLQHVIDAQYGVLENSGDRLATFMYYLSDVKEGGATVFPELSVAIFPVKLSAVFWYNFKIDGERDTRTLHGACPVMGGQKWIATKWIRQLSGGLSSTCELSETPPPFFR